MAVEPPPPASKAWIAWILVGLLLVLLAVAGYFAVRGRGVARATPPLDDAAVAAAE